MVSPARGKAGFIDETGAWAVPPTLTCARPFSDGLASAEREKGQSGYIDRAGNWVVQPEY
jgi:hypothetical protein